MTAQAAFTELKRHHLELPARLLETLAMMAKEIEQLKAQIAELKK